MNVYSQHHFRHVSENLEALHDYTAIQNLKLQEKVRKVRNPTFLITLLIPCYANHGQLSTNQRSRLHFKSR